MASKGSSRSPVRRWAGRLVALIVIATVAYVRYRHSGNTETHHQPPPAGNRETRVPEKARPPAKPAPQAESPSAANGYEIYQNCGLVDAPHNDGDSFMVRFPDGREKEMRLYFVDTPESAFKRYRGGETNFDRIRQQAADLGGITPEQAVEVGKKAKAYTLGLLAAAPFTIYTKWDSPFHDNRYHAFVEVRQGNANRWLHELLVEHGFVRIYTKPADLPDGTPANTQRKRLREMEAKAKRNNTGVWGY